MKILSRAIRTRYWKPGDDYGTLIVQSLFNEVRDGDIVAISEKALAIAQGRIVDESIVSPGLAARILALFWMRVVWGSFLGRVCRLKKVNIARLRGYPLLEGARHKQVCLQQVGFLRSLLPFSEGGIDTTNLPYSFASLPIPSPNRLAQQIRTMIVSSLGKYVSVVIVDSDKTYSCGGVRLSTRATDFPGIVEVGFFAYLIGRIFKWTVRSTPLGWAGCEGDPDYALRLAGLANTVRGYGAGRTAWDMAARFGVTLTQVTWSMLEQVEHRPIVVLRVETSGQEPDRSKVGIR